MPFKYLFTSFLVLALAMGLFAVGHYLDNPSNTKQVSLKFAGNNIAEITPTSAPTGDSIISLTPKYPVDYPNTRTDPDLNVNFSFPAQWKLGITKNNDGPVTVIAAQLDQLGLPKNPPTLYLGNPNIFSSTGAFCTPVCNQVGTLNFPVFGHQLTTPLYHETSTNRFLFQVPLRQDKNRPLTATGVFTTLSDGQILVNILSTIK